MNKKSSIVLFIILFFLMFATTIWASLQQNLFTEFSWSGSPMWFKATIVDFYINQFILWLGVVCLEPKSSTRFIWLVLFFCFGSMGTAGYLAIRLLSNKPIFKERSV